MVSRVWSPRSLRWFLALWTGGAAFFAALSVWVAWEDAHGGDTTATVLQVRENPDGTVQYGYQMTFTLPDGTACEAERKLLPRSEKVHVGDTIAVHYSRLFPCENVQRADASRTNWAGFAVTASGMVAVGAVALVVVTRRARGQAPKLGP